jgi:uncharacterized protein DUF6208
MARAADRSVVRHIRSALLIALELPFALVSLALYLAVRALMRRAVRAHFAKRPELAASWRVVSRELLEKPIARIAAVATAPRWNTHAIVASAGPFVAKSSIAVQLAPVRRSAAAWAIVVHAHPSQRPLMSFSGRQETEHAEVAVEPGSYMLMSRYYHPLDEPELPEVRIDGKPVVSACRVPRDANDFYPELSHRVGTIAIILHFHVVTLLRLSRLLPAELVRRHMAPVGAPNTVFLYGVIERGERMRLGARGSLRETHEIFYDLYGRDSLPFAWGEMDRDDVSTDPAPRTGFYLIRVQARADTGGGAFDDRNLELSLI